MFPVSKVKHFSWTKSLQPMHRVYALSVAVYNYYGSFKFQCVNCLWFYFISLEILFIIILSSSPISSITSVHGSPWTGSSSSITQCMHFIASEIILVSTNKKTKMGFLGLFFFKLKLSIPLYFVCILFIWFHTTGVGCCFSCFVVAVSSLC